MRASEGLTINALCVYGGAGQTAGRRNTVTVQGDINELTDKSLAMSLSISTGLIFPELIDKTVNADGIKLETDKGLAASLLDGFEETDEDASDDIPDIISGALFFANLMNYRSVDSSNTASVAGVRIDTEVATGIQQITAQLDEEAYIKPEAPGQYSAEPSQEGLQPAQAEDLFSDNSADNVNTLSNKQAIYTQTDAGIPLTPQGETITAGSEGYFPKDDSPSAVPSIIDALAGDNSEKAELMKQTESLEKATNSDIIPEYTAAGSLYQQPGWVADKNAAQAVESKLSHSKNKAERADNKINTDGASDIADTIIRTIRDLKTDGADGKSAEDKAFDGSSTDSGGVKEKPDKISDKPFEGSINSLSSMTGNGSDGTAVIAEKNAAVEKALGRFADDFKFAETGRNEIKIRLEPEEYGDITISVSKTENGISAKILSEDKELCHAVSSHIQKLIDSMEAKGVSLKEVDVVYTQAETDFTYNGSSGGEGQRNQYNRNYLYYRANVGENGRSDFFDQWLANPEAVNEQIVAAYGNIGAGAAYTVEYRI